MKLGSFNMSIKSEPVPFTRTRSCLSVPLRSWRHRPDMQGHLPPTFPYENKTEQGKVLNANKGKDLKGWVFTLNTLLPL